MTMDVDFTAAGDRIAIEIESFSGPPQNLWVSAGLPGMARGVGDSALKRILSGPGTQVYPLDEFSDPTVFSNVGHVIISGWVDGNQYTISNIELLPEPSTALLVGLGLAGVAAVKRRSSRRG